MKAELTGRLIEYSACKQVAARLGSRARDLFTAVRAPQPLVGAAEYTRPHKPEQLVQAWYSLMGRSLRKRKPSQERFEPLVTAPFVSVASRVAHMLRGLLRGTLGRMRSCSAARRAAAPTWPPFLALLELVRAGRVQIGEGGRLKVDRTHHRDRKEADADEMNSSAWARWKLCCSPTASRWSWPAWPTPCMPNPSRPRSCWKNSSASMTSGDGGLVLLNFDDRWQMATRPYYGEIVKRILDARRNAPLSPAALEVLAVIAYNQPVSRSFIEQVRGVDSSSTVAKLLDKGADRGGQGGWTCRVSRWPSASPIPSCGCSAWAAWPICRPCTTRPRRRRRSPARTRRRRANSWRCAHEHFVFGAARFGRSAAGGAGAGGGGYAAAGRAGYPLAPRRPAGSLADSRPAAAEVFPVSGRNAARRQKRRRKNAGCSTPRGPQKRLRRRRKAGEDRPRKCRPRPEPPQAETAAPAKPAAASPEEEFEAMLGKLMSDPMRHVRRGQQWAKGPGRFLLARLRVRHLRIVWTVTEQDAAATAVTYGALMAALQHRLGDPAGSCGRQSRRAAPGTGFTGERALRTLFCLPNHGKNVYNSSNGAADHAGRRQTAGGAGAAQGFRRQTSRPIRLLI